MFGFWVCKYVRESFVSYINYNDVLQCWWYGKWFCCTFWMYFILGAFRLYWNFYFFFVGCECVCTLWIFNVHYGFLTASAILSMQNKTKQKTGFLQILSCFPRRVFYESLHLLIWNYVELQESFGFTWENDAVVIIYIWTRLWKWLKWGFDVGPKFKNPLERKEKYNQFIVFGGKRESVSWVSCGLDYLTAP